jgi:hypothetical protein
MDLSSLSSWAAILVAGFAAYLGGYMSEKGKRLAAKEEAEQIRAELARTTQALKEVEARISLDLWREQKRWDERRGAFERLLAWVDNLHGGLAQIPEGASAGQTHNGILAALAGDASHQYRSAVVLGQIFLPAECTLPFLGLAERLLTCGSLDQAMGVCTELREHCIHQARLHLSAGNFTAQQGSPNLD